MRHLFFLIVLVLGIIFVSGCTQNDQPQAKDDQPASSGINKSPEVPKSTDTAQPNVGKCSKQTDELKLEHCLVNRALDAGVESACANINEDDFKAFFEKSKFHFYYHLNEVDPAKKDTDGDGLSDIKEAEIGTNPNKADSDDDGLKDENEMMNIETNKIDTDPLNPDTDGDGFSDGAEITSFYDPKDPADKPTDKDNDKMQDSWETKHGLNPSINDANEDPDGDGLTNLQEFQFDSNPQSKDSDGDGFDDKAEYEAGSCSNSVCGTDETPENLDFDGDGTPDKEEIQHVEKNRAEKIQQMKYTCYAVLAINLRDTSLCEKSGFIEGGGIGTDFRPRCRDIIEALNDPTKIKRICEIYSGTLALARIKC